MRKRVRWALTALTAAVATVALIAPAFAAPAPPSAADIAVGQQFVGTFDRDGVAGGDRVSVKVVLFTGTSVNPSLYDCAHRASGRITKVSGALRVQVDVNTVHRGPSSVLTDWRLSTEYVNSNNGFGSPTNRLPINSGTASTAAGNGDWVSGQEERDTTVHAVVRFSVRWNDGGLSVFTRETPATPVCDTL